MIVVLLALLGFLALACWGLAAWAAIAVVTMSESGQRLKNYFRLGLWKFAMLETALGPSVVPHLRRYRLAFMSLSAVILCIVIVAGLLAVERQN